jgi:putative ABC transport system permease protein
VLNQISFVIQFMSVFSMLTGLIVLVGSVLLSKFQRIQESVLLRTLGATRRQIFYINSLEYLILGSLASLSGIGLSVASGWLLCVYVFKLNFFVQFLPLLFLWLGISAVTVFIGWLNGRSVLNKTPLEVLRAEV